MTYFKKWMKSFLLCLLSISLLANPTAANDGPVIIRDTEIENILKEWMAPLLKAAGLGENSINLILVQSNQVNAFVAGGANIFLYTGLIEASDSPEEIIGVLAHETGHITGGHLIGLRDAFERASYESILGAVLGIGAAIVTGNGGAASAIISGSQHTAQRRLLSNSRVNESSADQAALTFLEKSHINPGGLKTFLEKLKSDEFLPQSQQSEYVRTHPLTSNRIDALETRIQKSSYKQTSTPELWKKQHSLMKAKLIGYITPGRVAWVYNDMDSSTPAKYARAIAAHRQNQTEKSLPQIDELLSLEPRNPYFLELKGQTLVEFGRVKEAISYYKQAVKYKPDSGLIRIALAHAIIESGATKKDLEKAAEHLQRALREEPRSGRAHRLLATIYGRTGRAGLAKLHLAEEALLHRRFPYAKSQAEAARQKFQKNSREWVKANDILFYIDHVK